MVIAERRRARRAQAPSSGFLPLLLEGLVFCGGEVGGGPVHKRNDAFSLIHKRRARDNRCTLKRSTGSQMQIKKNEIDIEPHTFTIFRSFNLSPT